jgi:uncharacterized tellurite resistance protein B-like protein
MKVRDRIAPIADILLGAIHADGRQLGDEKRAVEALLRDLILRPELPQELSERIARFDPQQFRLEEAVAEFDRDPPMQRRRLLELVAKICVSDGEFDLEEDDYLRRLARGLKMEPREYEDLVLDYELSDMRRTFELLRTPPDDGDPNNES